MGLCHRTTPYSSDISHHTQASHALKWPCVTSFPSPECDKSNSGSWESCFCSNETLIAEFNYCLDSSSCADSEKIGRMKSHHPLQPSKSTREILTRIPYG